MRKRRTQPSTPDDPNLSNTKRVGERSEAAFLYEASQRGFAICKPWGDSERYDFILDNRPQPTVHLFRIQIKCTDSLGDPSPVVFPFKFNLKVHAASASTH